MKRRVFRPAVFNSVFYKLTREGITFLFVTE